MPSPTDLELAVFRTLCWFSVFGMPLTRFEVWKWLLAPARTYHLFEVDQALEGSVWLFDRLQEFDGRIALKHLSLVQQIADGHRRRIDACRKFMTLRKAASFFQLLPSIQAVFAVNSLAWSHTNAQSDIDLYIVTKPNRLWSSRFFLVFPFLLLGQRSQHGHTSVQDPFCFSFFSTSTALQFESLKWTQSDYYLAYWMKSMVPIFDHAQIGEQIAHLNKWTDIIIPHASRRIPHPLHRPRRFIRLPIQWSWMEPFFRAIQHSRFPTILKELANKDTRVVITDEMLKFHDNDRRQDFLLAFEDVYETHR